MPKGPNPKRVEASRSGEHCVASAEVVRPKGAHGATLTGKAKHCNRAVTVNTVIGDTDNASLTDGLDVVEERHGGAFQ